MTATTVADAKSTEQRFQQRMRACVDNVPKWRSQVRLQPRQLRKPYETFRKKTHGVRLD